MPAKYVVQSGDTLGRIIENICHPASNIELQNMIEQAVTGNGLVSADIIYIGQELVLTCAEGEIPEAGQIDYIVQAGDTLSEIAAAHKQQCPQISWKQIAKDNNILPPYIIQPGDHITINCLGIGGGPTDEILLHNVPYYSQNDSSSNLSSTDCGPTCVRMLIGWDRIRNNQPDQSDPTVNQLWQATGKGPNDLMGLNELITMAGNHGLTLHLQRSPDATIEWIEDQIISGLPVIMLCHYERIKKPWSSWNAGHFIVVIGFSPTHIFYHDPNWSGAAYRIADRATFDLAIGQDNQKDGNQVYQGLSP